MKKRKALLKGSISLMVLAVICGEYFARNHLGLGNPPLSISHPRIEYMFKPNQDVYRFGNRIIINRYGMRAKPFTTQKGNDEFRVMVYGDSVLNGGNLTDHADLATTLLNDRLTLQRKDVVVGNISAGSWGPGNWLAYAREYGFFDADAVALVISSHDYADNPTFQPLNSNTHPTEPPYSALVEGIERYLPRYFPKFRATMAHRITTEKEVQKAIDNLRRFIELAKNKSKIVLVFQHFEKSEIIQRFVSPGYQKIKNTCEQLGIIPISLEPFFRQSIDAGVNPYRDNIHPNKVGQQLLAEAFIENLPRGVQANTGEDL